MSVTVKNPVVKQAFDKVKKPPIKQALNAVKDDLVKDAQSRGWRRFNKGIETKQDSDTKGRIFVNENVTGPGTATNKQIGGWLHYGRGEVRPVKAQALRWVMRGGGVVFAKLSKATKPTFWYGLKDSAIQKVKDIYAKWLKSFGK